MTSATRPYQLEADTIGTYLVEHGLAGAGVTISVEPLSGGVSNDILAVSLGCHTTGPAPAGPAAASPAQAGAGPAGAGATDLVVKQALPRLRVAEEWLATPQRIAREAAAIDLAGSICPGSVPRVVYLDLASHLLVMTRAARQARTWKADLLAGRIDRAVAERAGQLIGRWHAVTAADPDLVTAFSDTEAFVQLRIDPYHRTVASRHPQLAGRIEELAAGLLDRPQCLVHGDLSPKNVLVDVEDRLAEVGTAVQTGADAEADAGVAHQIWLIDWEVAHLGNPIFDLAFVLCHLRCKAARCPADAGRLAESAGAFLGAYQAEAAAVWATVDEGELAAQTACLLLARVDGKSPVEYLDPPAQQLVRQVAVGLLRAGNPGLDAIFAA